MPMVILRFDGRFFLGSIYEPELYGTIRQGHSTPYNGAWIIH